MSIKYSGENVLTYLLGLLNTKFQTKVDKVDGKGLSTNDYTTAEKTKLSGIEENANNYSHPAGSAASKTSGLYKFATDASSHISSVTAVKKADITALGIPAQDTTYEDATTTQSGLMSATDKASFENLKTTVEGLTATGGEPNQNAFSNIQIGETTIAADEKMDTLTFEAGDHITITPDSDGDKVTVAATNVVSRSGDTMTGDLNIGVGMSSVDSKLQLQNRYNSPGPGSVSSQNGGMLLSYSDSSMTIYLDQAGDRKSYIKLTGDGVEFSDPAGVVENLGITATAAELNYVDGVTSNIQTQLNDKAAKSTTLAGYGITDSYTKEEINNMVSSVLTYKGTVAKTSDLPTTGLEVGHVYNVSTKSAASGNLPAVNAGDNVAWNGTSWDVLAGTVDLEGYVETTDVVEFTNTEVQAIWDSVMTA